MLGQTSGLVLWHQEEFMAPRILILSASVGAGHLRAAEAVEQACKQMLPDATVRNLDILEMTNRVFRRIYGQFYLDLINKAPHVLGYFYDLLDKPSKSGLNRGDRFRLMVEKMNLNKFTRFLLGQPWDLVINTHFLPAEIIAALRKAGKTHVPQVIATTDFETHRLWVNQPCERYFTATDEGALYLHSWGVPKEATYITGIPIHPVFSVPKDRAALLAKHGLDGSQSDRSPTGGRFWRWSGREVVHIAPHGADAAASRRGLRPQRDRQSGPGKARLAGASQGQDCRLHQGDRRIDGGRGPCYFQTGRIDDFGNLARGAVMVIVNPIPGQESRNSDYLLENGAAIKVNNATMLPHKVTALCKTRSG